MSWLSNGFGTWQGVVGRLIYEPAPGNASYVDLATEREFNSSGNLLSLGHVHEFAGTWIVSGFATTSTGGDFLPSSKFDLSVGHKLLADLSLVPTVGLSIDHFRNGHSDQALVTGVAWYGLPRWVLEGEVRFNRSDPGGVGGRRYAVAATWGEEGKNYVAARGETGNEAYQVIGNGAALVNFDSQLIGLSWRHWLRADRGFVTGGEVYHNPDYHRVGVSVAGFLQF